MDNLEKVIKKVNCEKFPIGCGIIFKTDDLKKVGKYNEKIKIFEDKDLINKLKKINLKYLELLYRFTDIENIHQI